MIIGVGIDIVDLDRFAASLERTPHLKERLFTAQERERAPASLAATFAAKEAIAKSLGAPGGLEWHDAEVRRDETGRPYVFATGTVADAATERGVVRWHLSLSHDSGAAIAMVIAEGDE